MYDFNLDGKPDRISRKIIIQNYENSGLKMINIEAFIHSLKSSWIKRLTGKQNQWKTAYNIELNRYGGELLFKCNLSKNDAKNIPTKYTFLKQVVMSWCKIKLQK